MQNDTQSLANRYEALMADRQPYLDRAYKVAELTLPHLLPREGVSKAADLPVPWQAMGARCVTSLASKLNLTLFPPSQSLFRYQTDPWAIRSLGEEVQAEVEKSLSEIERTATTEIESSGMRPHLYGGFEQQIIAGNVLLDKAEEGETKVHKLDTYVCKRDQAGKVLLIVLKECLSWASAPEVVRGMVDANDLPADGLDDTIDIYTGVAWNGKKYEVYQELFNGGEVPTTRGSYLPDDLPYLALRMEVVTGSSYGYGYATRYLGDLVALDQLTKALVEGAAASAKVLFLVKPSGFTDAEELARAPSGSIRSGNAEEVGCVKVDKAADMRVAFEAAQQLNKNLGFAFLLNSSVQRSGERVTAEEIRLLANELQDVLSGSYATMAQNFQLPIVKLTLSKLRRENRIPKIPKELKAEPTILAGLDALGRGHDLARLDTLIAGAINTFGPELIAKYMNVSDYLTRRATAIGLSTDGLIRSAEEVAQADQQAQLQAMVQQGIGPGINAISKQQVAEQEQQQPE